MRGEDGKYYAIPNGDLGYMKNVWNASGYYPDNYDPATYQLLGGNPKTQTNGDAYTAIWVRDDVLQALMPGVTSSADIMETVKHGGTFTEEQIFDVGLESAEDFFQFLRDIKQVIAEGDFVDGNGNPIEVTWGFHSEENYYRFILRNRYNWAYCC